MSRRLVVFHQQTLVTFHTRIAVNAGVRSENRPRARTASDFRVWVEVWLFDTFKLAIRQRHESVELSADAKVGLGLWTRQQSQVKDFFITAFLFLFTGVGAGAGAGGGCSGSRKNRLRRVIQKFCFRELSRLRR